MSAVNYLTHVKHRKALEEIRDIVTAAINGEPTTADEYNYEHDQLDEIDEMNEAIKETPEYKLGKKVFGGDTGTDADYYNEEYVKDDLYDDLHVSVDYYDENNEEYIK